MADRDKLVAEIADSRAGVEDHSCAAAGDLDATGIAAEREVVR